jgi:hypothetical protein
MNTRHSRACAISLAAPVLAAIAWLIFVIGGDMMGSGPYANLAPKNSAEAAMWSRQLELVQLLDDQDTITREDRSALACLAADLKVEDVAEYLAPEGTGHCVPTQTLERIIARSRSL